MKDHLMFSLLAILLVASTSPLPPLLAEKRFEPKGYIANHASYYPYLADHLDEVNEIVDIHHWYAFFPEKIQHYAQRRVNSIMFDKLPESQRAEILLKKTFNKENYDKIRHLPQPMKDRAMQLHRYYHALPLQGKKDLIHYTMTYDNSVLQDPLLVEYLQKRPIKIIRRGVVKASEGK